MPYKTGKLKGKLTTAEIRKLIRAHNILVSIKVPPKTDRDGLIALIEKNGFKLDEEKGRIKGITRPRKPTITIQRAKELTKPKEKTELQKQQLKQKKEEKMKKLKDDKEKEEKAFKKEGVKEFKEGLKKAKTTKTKPPPPPPPKATGRGNPKSTTATIYYKDFKERKHLDWKKVERIPKKNIRTFVEKYTKSSMTDAQEKRITEWLKEVHDERVQVVMEEHKNEWIIFGMTAKTPYIKFQSIHMKKKVGRGNKKEEKED